MRDPPRTHWPTPLVRGGPGRCQHDSVLSQFQQNPRETGCVRIPALLSLHLPQNNNVNSPGKISLQDIFPKAWQTKRQAEAKLRGGNSAGDRRMAGCVPFVGGAVCLVGTQAA